MQSGEQIGDFPMRDGCRISYRIYEHEQPQSVLLLLPGFGLNSDDYVSLCERLVKTSPTIVYNLDLRGHGNSQGIAGDVAYIGQLQDDFADVMAALGARHPELPLVLTAHSGSSSLAIAYLAAQKNSQVKALFLIAPVFFGYMEFDRQIKKAYRYVYYGRYHHQPYENVISTLTVNQQFRYSLGRHMLAMVLPWQQRMRVLQVRRDEGQSWKGYSFRFVQSYRCHRLQDALEDISVPVRVLVGMEDEVILPDAVFSMLNWHLAPNVLRETRCLRGMGHFSILAVSALLLGQWLRITLAEINRER